MVRRKSLALIALFVLLPLCGEAVEAPVLVEVGHMSLSSKMLPWFMEEVNAFMAAHPDIAVEVRDFNEPDRKRVMLKDVPDLAANVIAVDPWSGYEVAYLASRGLIVPVDAFLPDPEFSLEDFHANLLENVRFDDKTWGIPYKTETLVLAYKPAMLAAAGIAAPPTTWEEFKEAAKKLTIDSDGEGELEQYGFAILDQGRMKNIFSSMVVQRGGRLFNGDQVDFLNAEARQALKDWRDIASAPFTRHAWFAGQAPHAMEIVGWQHFMERIKTDRDVALAPLPSYGKPAQASMGSVFLAVRRSTPEREAASWAFVKWLSRKDAPLPPGYHGIGCRRDVVTHPALLAQGAGWCGNWQEMFESNAHVAGPPATGLIGAQQAFECLVNQYVLALQRSSDLDRALLNAAEEARTHVQPLEIVDPAGYDLFY